MLSDEDVLHVEKRREDFVIHRNSTGYKDTGYVAHFGRPVKAGDVFPLLITHVDHEHDLVSGQVFLNGSDNLFVENVSEGQGQDEWSWPPRVG